MKKIILSAAALLVSITAVAEEQKTVEVSFSAEGTFYGTAYKSVVKDENGSYSAIQFAPSLSLKKGIVEGVLSLEYNGLYGVNPSENTDTSEDVGLGGGKIRLEVAEAYFKTSILSLPGLSIKAGIAELDYAMIFGDNAPLAGFSYETEKAGFNAYYVKTYEGEYSKNSDDSNIFWFDAFVNFGESKIAPGFFMTRTKENSDGQFRDSTGYIGALNTNLVFGSAGIDLAAAFASGKDKVDDVKYRGYAFDAAPYISPAEGIKIGAFFTAVSGDDPDTAGKNESFLFSTIDGTGAGINNFRLYIVEDGGSFSSITDVTNAGKYGIDTDGDGETDFSPGYYAAGLSFEGGFGDFSAKLQGAYVSAMKTPSGWSKKMGIEVDANLSYALSPEASIFTEGAFLSSGKFYEFGGMQEKQNSYYGILGMTYTL
ncbi:MAG TPA: hypothetical protein PLE16_06230 [Spirochaetota bacterium]|nr:hypothetical protein [Spirochaetota bacterium]HOH36898.1 hypothetical protein [Spirochaetota bacterium]HPJ15242.1 hypothetical protein [Spirochaetota bacterium]HPM34181.1 hypothetical protein [Spirochaetota bacterium]HPW51314.1 hypothetical protein [Spirochaetota bacterium]